MEKSLRQKSIDETTEQVLKLLAWVKPEIAMDVCRKVYDAQKQRERERLKCQ